jgi:hypothetical protein
VTRWLLLLRFCNKLLKKRKIKTQSEEGVRLKAKKLPRRDTDKHGKRNILKVPEV